MPTCPSSTSRTRSRPWRRSRRRAKVVEAIRKQEWDDRVLCVRVNAWDTEWTVGDVIEVVSGAGERLDEVMLPKVQRAAEVVALDLLLTQVEKTSGLPVGHIGIEAQIETTTRSHQRGGDLRGVPEARDDHLRPGRLRRIDGDAGPDRRCEVPEYPGDHFHYVFSKILMAGRANGLQVIDGPFLKVRELDSLAGLRTAHPKILGYDGKWALTPDQVDVLNEVYSPTQEQFDRALGHPRGLPARHRGRSQGRGHVRRRDDRRGEPQDGRQVRRAR